MSNTAFELAGHAIISLLSTTLDFLIAIAAA